METAKKYIGADIGGTFIKLGIVSHDGEISMRREVPIDRSGSEGVMDTLFRAIDELLRESGMGTKAFAGIGVSAAGCIDSAKGCVAKNGGNVPGWPHTQVAGPLMARYGIPASIANDGNCVALAEAWIGAAKGLKDVVCVVLGTGIGGGIICGGRLVEGRHGFGGEIGHFPTHAEHKPASTEDHGSHYEWHASTSALVRMAADMDGSWHSGRDVFNAADAGDSRALAALDEWTDQIAAGITGLVHIFDPEMVIIGGGVSAQDDLLIKPLREKVLNMVEPDFAADLEIRAASLGNGAGMAGAVKYFMDSRPEG